MVRLKMPRDGALVIDDKVRGRVEFAWEREQDHVIQRADGSCLYHLASVVDDHGLAMTHVIRAEEHLSNALRQAFIAPSLGYELPTYAHLPLVAEPGSRTKLSKRKLALMLPFLVKAKLVSDRLSAAAVTMVRKVIEASGDRLKVSGDILAYADFFLVEKPPMDEAALKQRLAKPSAGDLLKAYAKALEAAEPFEPAALEAALKQAVEAAGVKVSDLVHAVRVAMTGKTVGPGLYDCLAIRGASSRSRGSPARCRGAGRGRRARGEASREGSRAGLLGAAPTGTRGIPPLIVPAHAPFRFSRCRVKASRALW